MNEPLRVVFATFSLCFKTSSDEDTKKRIREIQMNIENVTSVAVSYFQTNGEKLWGGNIKLAHYVEDENDA